MGFSLDNTTSKATSYTHATHKSTATPPDQNDGRDVRVVKSVAIIGAGVAGLQLAERLKLAKENVRVTIFEATDHVGGVWSSNYADFGLQVPKELYEFPAFPYPANKEWSRFPKGPEVQEYIEAFAEHFKLNELIRFNTIVTAAKPLDHGWALSVAPTGSRDASATEAFDFLVVATGMYGGACPHMPTFPGKESFGGDVLHSFNFTERAQAAGKRVVVVGGGKSAVDCAVAAVKGGAEEVTLLFREAHWPVPRYILDLIPFKFATYSRFGHALLPTHHDVSALVWWLHAIVTPIKWLVWRLVERIFTFQFALSGDLKPSSRIEIDVFTGGQILTYEARDMIKSGALKVCKNSIASYTPGGVDLAREGASIACDMVVFGTGFVKSYDYFDTDTQAKLQIEKDGLYLYRSMLPVGVPGLAFLGSEVSTFNNILTHGLQAAWLAKVLSGAISLPPPREIQRTIEAEKNWKRTWMPSTSARAAIQQLHMPKYHDRLVADMCLPTCRKSNPLFELLLPYNARDYRTIFGLPDHTTWMRFKTTLVLVALLLSWASCVNWLVVAGVCAVAYRLPEEPPRLAIGHAFRSLVATDSLKLASLGVVLYSMRAIGLAVVAEM